MLMKLWNKIIQCGQHFKVPNIKNYLNILMGVTSRKSSVLEIALKKSTVRATKHISKTLFGIFWSNFIETRFNCQFNNYYDAKSLIWNVYCDLLEIKHRIFCSIIYLLYTIVLDIGISFSISHLVLEKFMFYQFSVFFVYVFHGNIDCLKKLQSISNYWCDFGINQSRGRLYRHPLTF